MKFVKISLVIAAVALMAMMVVNVHACVGPGLSPGFWKHNIGVYLGYNNGEYSDPGYTGGRVSKETMGDWLGTNWSHDYLETAFAALSTRGGGAAGAAIRVAYANVFNAAADLTPYVD